MSGSGYRFFLGDLVQCSVVDTESEFAVFFLDKHDR